MGRTLVALLAVAALCACTRVVVPPSPTPATYTGPRTQGYPTPLLVRVEGDGAGGAYVVSRGALGAVVQAYVAAWQLDGWAITPGWVIGETVTLDARHDDEAHLLYFAAIAETGLTGVLVWIAPGP